MREAEARLAALEAERDALRADAERYRFLKPRYYSIDLNFYNWGISVLSFKMDDHHRFSADLDSTIDAARGVAHERHD